MQCRHRDSVRNATPCPPRQPRAARGLLHPQFDARHPRDAMSPSGNCAPREAYFSRRATPARVRCRPHPPRDVRTRAMPPPPAPRPRAPARRCPSGASREEIDAVIAKAKEKGRVALIYLESPANPTNQLVDVEAVSAARPPRPPSRDPSLGAPLRPLEPDPAL